MKKHNFFAGPAILPEIVKKQASEALLDFANMGLSVMEISHRSSQWVEAMNKAIQLPKDLLDIPDEYEVLYLTGGASSQFYMTAMNLLDSSGTAGYIDTGTWSSKAIKEAKLFGEIDIVASSKDKNYSYIPKAVKVSKDLSYLHYTTNNTIYGTQYSDRPQTEVRLVADMSSDIFSKAIDVSAHDVIYCGAQKNMGPAGVTLVIVNRNALGKVNRQIPSMLDYRTHINKGSMFNTPPVLPIYISMLTMQWVKDQGGVSQMEQRNQKKADMLYQAIDVNPMFEGVVSEEDRSIMNVTFRSTNSELDETFEDMTLAAGIYGIKGHRSVGGFRASIYNALEIDSVAVLVEVMNEFAQKYG